MIPIGSASSPTDTPRHVPLRSTASDPKRDGWHPLADGALRVQASGELSDGKFERAEYDDYDRHDQQHDGDVGAYSAPVRPKDLPELTQALAEVLGDRDAWCDPGRGS